MNDKLPQQSWQSGAHMGHIHGLKYQQTSGFKHILLYETVQRKSIRLGSGEIWVVCL